ncbi:MAG TPA: S41 family peptidase [Allosphingosinicella sp.]|uniref:S41 family peptidase n=1 Tax=Allosphingosinicella sp. TaxID=2823234 RepID=UPI002ED94DA4
MNLLRLPVIALALGLASPSAALAETSLWARMAEEDLAAAYALIAENHPAAVPEAGDQAFRASFRRGYEEARALAQRATNYNDYRATLQRFAGALGDRHLRSNALLSSSRFFWPGFLAADGYNGWRIVTREDENAPPLDSRLLDCDGRNPNDLAEQRFGQFTPNWSIRAERLMASPRLLLDTGTSSQPRATSCTFETPAGARVTHHLSWRPIGLADASAQLQRASRMPAQDVGLRSFRKGWWVRLGTLNDRARPVIDEAQARRAELRAAPFVVVDLRGNGGGASTYSDRLAKTLYGSDRVQRAKTKIAGTDEDLSVWRVSPANLATLESYVERFTRELGANDSVVTGLIAERDAMRAALGQGQALSRSRSPWTDRSSGLSDRVARPPQVILITDRFCFSSCLRATALFRALGALHVGEETNGGPKHNEIRQIVLPSGLSDFSTMQAYDGLPGQRLGPYSPARPFSVSAADDSAVETWVETLPEVSGKHAPGAVPTPR